MKLNSLLNGISATCCGRENIEIAAIVSDSRKLTDGCAFVCIRGGKFDGHDFASEAAEKGAVAIIAEEKPTSLPETVTLVLVPNTREALAYMWDNWYGNPSAEMKLIGITGTNGKTTTSYAIKALLEEDGRSVGVIGTLGTVVGERAEGLPNGGSDMVFGGAAMTTPDPEILYRLLRNMADEGVEYIVMEVSSHALAQYKVKPLRFEIAVFTNLGDDHLDFHKTQENYFYTKASLFRQSKKGIVNYEDPYGRKLAEVTACDLIFCSTDPRHSDRSEVQYTAVDFANRYEDGIEYTLHSCDTVFRIKSSVIGTFNVGNTLLAAVCALECGVEPETVRDALKKFRGVEGRMERVADPEGKANFSVVIDYAHTPEALHLAIECMKGRAAGKLMVLFGCGGDRDPKKRPKMGRVAVTEADYAIITSDNCRTESPHAILSDILMGVGEATNYIMICDREEAVRYAMNRAEKGDILLLLGKGHEKYEITAEGKIPFDEKKIVLEEYGRIFG